MSKKKRCDDCLFAVFKDEGYSNYTVENTDFYCAKKLHPDGKFDRFYGEDKRLEFAENCSGFVAGPPVEVDVDGDNSYSTEAARTLIIWAEKWGMSV